MCLAIVCGDAAVEDDVFSQMGAGQNVPVVNEKSCAGCCIGRLRKGVGTTVDRPSLHYDSSLNGCFSCCRNWCFVSRPHWLSGDRREMCWFGRGFCACDFELW